FARPVHRRRARPGHSNRRREPARYAGDVRKPGPGARAHRMGAHACPCRRAAAGAPGEWACTDRSRARARSRRRPAARDARRPAGRAERTRSFREAGMILCIDAGNSKVKWGWHDGKDWTSIATVSLIEFAASSDHVNPFSVTHEAPERIVISNVAGEGAHQLLVNWTSIFDAEPLWLRAEAERCGVENRYEKPEVLGPDRWAALIAARALHNGAALVVNAGTATTVDMLSAEGVFLGGAILPGVELMRFVLHEHTGRLPIEEGKSVEMPRNTIDAIETGCRHAQAGAVERMYRVFREAASAPLCIVAGGAGRSLVDQLAMPRRYVENLVLDGLAQIAVSERAAASAKAMLKTVR